LAFDDEASGASVLASSEEVERWLRAQQEVVILVSAYLAPIKTFLEECAAGSEDAADPGTVHRFHAVVRDWDWDQIRPHIADLNLDPYTPFLVGPQSTLVGLATAQTMPSECRASDEFANAIWRQVDKMSECVLAIAKSPPPTFSATLVAGSPFRAYLLLSHLIESATEYVLIADAYLDASLFDRYLYRVSDNVQVRLRTDSRHWNRRGWKEQFEQAEQLYSAEHPLYERVDRTDLHARYLITETGGWRIDGSIKDSSVSKDCPVHTIPPAERARVIGDLFS